MIEAPPMVLASDAPKLLVEWSSPGREFLTAIRPALGRSRGKLAGEVRTRMFPYPGMLATWVLEGVLLFALIVLPAKFRRIEPYKPSPQPSYDVIYFSGEELPQTEDSGGAATGKAGRAGGHESYHRTQAIKVARGSSPAEKVVDVPRFNLPQSDLPVANLLALNKVPGPPPIPGMTSSLRAPAQAVALPPPPDIAKGKTHSVPMPTSSIVAPPPEVSPDKLHLDPGFPAPVVAPPPDVRRDRIESEPTFNNPIVPPSPSVSSSVSIRSDTPTRATQIVPPPVSAPVRLNATDSRLSLPEPGVVAPPPSGVGRGLASAQPTQMAGINGDVVPPPAEVGSVTGRTGSGTMDTRNSVVAPPPVQVGGAAGIGKRTSGDLLTTGVNVVPPPPTVGGGGSRNGRGRGRRGAGLGGDFDAGSVLGPPQAGGSNGEKAGVVISTLPGPRFAVPGNGGAGSMAMSPAGNAKSGLGGAGGGKGIVEGTGPGSGLEGEATGAGRTGRGPGSDPSSHAGISSYPGPGGAGKGTAGRSPAPGVSVAGGTTITLPSFGSKGDRPNGSPRSSVDGNRGGPAITVIASSRSGGAFNFYGALKGDKVYTIYINTTLGPAVLEYADPTSQSKTYAEDLTAPQPLRAELPAGLKPSRLIVACILDRSGMLRNLQLLEAGPLATNAKVLAALPAWKFSPAMRAKQPVEVNAILGFNIDTR